MVWLLHPGTIFRFSYRYRGSVAGPLKCFPLWQPGNRPGRNARNLILLRPSIWRRRGERGRQDLEKLTARQQRHGGNNMAEVHKTRLLSFPSEGIWRKACQEWEVRYETRSGRVCLITFTELPRNRMPWWESCHRGRLEIQVHCTKA